MAVMALTTPASIESRRLLLRIVRREDLAALMSVNGDPLVTDFLPYETWASLADAEAWFERMQTLQSGGTALQFVIVDKASQRAIGTCLLFRHEENSQRAELGYVLGRAFWRQGVMAEALRALLSAAFTTMALRRIEAEVNPANTASTRLLEAIGFVREGLLRQRWVAKGAPPHDVAVFGLLASEYKPR